MRPRDVLDEKRWLLEGDQYIVNLGRADVPEDLWETATRWIKHAPNWKNYLVTSDMVDICLHAAKELPAVPTPYEGLLPNKNGFLIFEKPCGTWINDFGNTYEIIGLAWYPTLEFADRKQYSDSGDHQVVPILRVHAASSVLAGQTGGPADVTGGRFKNIMGEIFDWPPSKNYEISKTYSPVSIEALTYTLWHLMGQTLIVSEPAELDRAARRQAARENLPSDIVVCKLRQQKRPPSETSVGSDFGGYSHRFLVSSHWKNQYYPSDGSHRQILILPYVKGPEDKPLIVKDQVTVLAR